MFSRPIPILFTHYGDQWFRGSERLLLDLVTHLDPARISPIVWCNGEAMAEAARAAGITTYRSDFDYYFDYQMPRFNWRRYSSFVREGIGLVKKHDIKILHANSAAPNQWLVPIARHSKVPLLSHLHIDYRRRSRFVCLLHQSTLVVGVSEQVIRDFIRDGMAPNRTKVIYNGINFARFEVPEGESLRSTLGIPEEAVVVAAIGSLIRRKGQDILLRAFARLDPAHDVRLLIVSDGPERVNLELLTADLGLQARVHFLGYYGDLPGVYRATDIVALASRGDAFGLVLAEAGYFSRPVVATMVGGIPEVIDNGFTGLLVPPDDPTALGDALSRLVVDPAYRRTLGRAARARTEQMFSVDQMVANFQDTYERLALVPGARLGWWQLGLTLNPHLRLLLDWVRARGRRAAHCCRMSPNV